MTATPGDYHIAQLNIATLRAPIDDPLIADFTDNLERINALGDGSPGFVWRLQTDDGNATSIHPYANPMTIVNMTVWTSVAALKDFAYRTDHAEFLARRREWFVAGSTGVVLWWIRAGDVPTVDDAKRRLEFLQRHGPSPYAFRFARPPEPFVIERTSLEDPDTLDLIAHLNEELTGRYDDPTDNHFRLEPDEVSPGVGAVVVGRLADRAVACGAIRRVRDIESDGEGDIDHTGVRTAEIKRMYVAPRHGATSSGPPCSTTSSTKPGHSASIGSCSRREAGNRRRSSCTSAPGSPLASGGANTRKHRTAGASRSDSRRRRRATTIDQAGDG